MLKNTECKYLIQENRISSTSDVTYTLFKCRNKKVMDHFKKKHPVILPYPYLDEYGVVYTLDCDNCSDIEEK